MTLASLPSQLVSRDYRRRSKTSEDDGPIPKTIRPKQMEKKKEEQTTTSGGLDVMVGWMWGERTTVVCYPHLSEVAPTAACGAGALEVNLHAKNALMGYGWFELTPFVDGVCRMGSFRCVPTSFNSTARLRRVLARRMWCTKHKLGAEHAHHLVPSSEHPWVARESPRKLSNSLF